MTHACHTRGPIKLWVICTVEEVFCWLQASVRILLLEKKVKMASILKKWEYLSNEKVFYSKVLSIFIIYLDLLFGIIAMKIVFVVFL